MRTPRLAVRMALLKAAEAEFRSKGFQAASLADVATSAKLTKGAIFSNFRGKDDLFLQVLERHVQAMIERYRAEMIEAEVPEVALDRLAAFLIQSAIDDGPWSAASAEFVLHASRRPETGAQLVKVRSHLRREVLALLRPLIDSGQADEARLERAVTLFFAISNGLTLESLGDPTRVDADVYRDALQRLLLS